MITQKEIIEKYPMLFRNLRSGKERFECGRGWNLIIDEVCYKMMDYIDKFPESVPSKQFDGIIVIKEKYGTLRIQGHLGIDVLSDFVDEAERKSSRVCEYCGAEGKTMTVWGWEKTLCPDCEKEETPV